MISLEVTGFHLDRRVVVSVKRESNLVVFLTHNAKEQPEPGEDIIRYKRRLVQVGLEQIAIWEAQQHGKSTEPDNRTERVEP